MPVFHPWIIPPFVPEVPHPGRGLGRALPAEGEGIAFVYLIAIVVRVDMIFVVHPMGDARDEPLPHARAIPPDFQGMSILVPAIEVPDHRNTLRIGSPHGKGSPLHPVDAEEMGTELVVEMEMTALLEQIDVVVGKGRHVISHGR
jgi:hypothetical protein